MTIAAIVFDWAGTMIDFGSIAPVIALRRAFEAEGLPVRDDEVRAGMGLAKRDHVRALLETPRVRAAWIEAGRPAPTEADADRINDALEPLVREAAAERARLIPGARETFEALRDKGVRIGSTTGYTRAMMGPILAAAADQGYAPELVVCAGETRVGRPSPLMLWKAMVELGVYPASAVVKVDDAPAGIAEGRAAGCFTVGVAASGNALGLSLEDYRALPADGRAARLADAHAALRAAGADLVIDSVADLVPALRADGRVRLG